ncbi:EAL domain-containing protein [Thiocapsa imhoffii]|nr:EAL domain-containing protein [Thiocapsa imhoffii]
MAQTMPRDETLTIGISAYRSEPLLIEQWRPLADYLESKLPAHRIALRILDAESLEQAVQRSELDFVFTNPANYIAIRTHSVLSGAIATLVRSETGHALAVLGGVIFTRADRDDLDSLAALRGKRIAIGSQRLLGGFAAPLAELLNQGVHPNHLRFEILGEPHDRVVEAVLSGAVDAGFVRTGIIEYMDREGRLDSPVKILAARALPGFPFALSTDLYPEWPFVALPSAGEETARRVAAALLALEPSDPAAQAAEIIGFTVPADYSSVETLLRQNRMPPFEHLPPIALLDLWEQHRVAFIVTPLFFLAILALLVWLTLANRKLSVARRRAIALGQRVETEHRYLEALVQTLPDLVWLKDPAGRYLTCNPRVEAFIGAARHDILGQSDADLLKPEMASEVQALDRAALTQGKPVTSVSWMTFARDGHRELIEATRVAIFDAEGQPFALLGIGHDITEQKRVEHDLRAITDGAAEGIWTSHHEGRFLYANPAALAMTGHSLDELMGLSVNDLVFPEDQERLRAHLSWMREHPAPARGLWRLRRKDGTRCEVDLTTQRLPDARILAIGRDLSHLRDHEEALFRAIYYDSLTGLPNRTLLLERLNQSLPRARRTHAELALIFLDLDYFGQINAGVGSSVGDQLLAEIAVRLRAQLRPEDTLARIGGDEFAILLDEFEKTDTVALVIERLPKTFAQPIAISGQSISVSASFGVTVFPEDDTDAETLLRHAMQAMYASKDLGRGRLSHFNVEKQRALVTRITELQRLREAVERDELLLYYQPKVDLTTGGLVGSEALIRWFHPDEGLLAPAAFLSLADGTELELRISEWVIEHALAQMTAWQAAGLRIPVSINLPAAHLLMPNFHHWLAAALNLHPNLDPRDFQIEILESTAIADMDAAVSSLRHVKDLGVSIALDDFGTGFSSLAYFRRLPVDTLKIDRSFVNEMLEDPHALGVVQYVIRLAKTFDRDVIAEGLETDDDWVALRQLDCDQAQGYGIARPMPPHELPSWLEDWNREGPLQHIAPLQYPDSDATLVISGIMHRRWVTALAAAIESGEIVQADRFEITHCPFQKWYGGIGRRRFGTLPDFRAIDSAHQRVHQLAGQIATKVDSGESDRARELLQTLVAVSNELLGSIERLAEHSSQLYENALEPRSGR